MEFSSALILAYAIIGVFVFVVVVVWAPTVVYPFYSPARELCRAATCGIL